MGNFGNKWNKFVQIFIEKNGYVKVVQGLQNTLLIAVVGMIIGVLIGTIIATVRVLPKYKTLPRALNAVCSFYVGLFRGTPMVVQLLIFYYVMLPLMGIKLPGVRVAMVVFGLNSGAYISEIMRSGDDAVFDKEIEFDAADIEPMVTYGTNPGMGMGVTEHIPTVEGMNDVEKASFMKSMEYMGFEPGESLLGKKIDYVFLGSCTNGRIEDFRAFASIVKGRKKADHVVAWLVPGSWLVDAQIREEGLDKIFEEAGFRLRQPGCSACLAMNDDKVPAGKYAVSTSNRNFEGRQGPGSRTLLASPLVAAAAAVTGVITDPRTLI